MKIYLAVSMTNAHNPAMLSQVVDHIRQLGHRVLSEHVAVAGKVASTEVLMRNAGLDSTKLAVMDPEAVALMIRDTDFRWVEECDAFIALFFGGSDGRGAEFEHLRLMMEMLNQLNGRGIIYWNARPTCRGILGLFDREHCSRLMWAANKREQEYYKRVFVQPDDLMAIMQEISAFLSEIKRKGAGNAQS